MLVAWVGRRGSRGAMAVMVMAAAAAAAAVMVVAVVEAVAVVVVRPNQLTDHRQARVLSMVRNKLVKFLLVPHQTNRRSGGG